MALLMICILAMQKGDWTQVFIPIYIDAINNFAHRHFTRKAFFEFVKLDIIVFDFAILVYKVAKF